MDIDMIICIMEIIFKIWYVKDEMIVDGDFSCNSFGFKYFIIEFQYMLGVDDLFGGQYIYYKFNLSYWYYFYMNFVGWMFYCIWAGKVFGNVFFLLMEVYFGNEGYLVGCSIFNMMMWYEFVSDIYVSLMLEYYFDGFFLNYVLFLCKFKFCFYVIFKVVMGCFFNVN